MYVYLAECGREMAGDRWDTGNCRTGCGRGAERLRIRKVGEGAGSANLRHMLLYLTHSTIIY